MSRVIKTSLIKSKRGFKMKRVQIINYNFFNKNTGQAFCLLIDSFLNNHDKQCGDPSIDYYYKQFQ
jgi:hypothetical protein